MHDTKYLDAVCQMRIGVSGIDCLPPTRAPSCGNRLNCGDWTFVRTAGSLHPYLRTTKDGNVHRVTRPPWLHCLLNSLQIQSAVYGSSEIWGRRQGPSLET